VGPLGQCIRGEGGVLAAGASGLAGLSAPRGGGKLLAQPARKLKVKKGIKTGRSIYFRDDGVAFRPAGQALPLARPGLLHAFARGLVLFGQRAVLVRVLAKRLHAILATEGDFLAVVVGVRRPAHAADPVARNGADGVDGWVRVDTGRWGVGGGCRRGSERFGSFAGTETQSQSG
jgi:hypothetical protein